MAFQLHEYDLRPRVKHLPGSAGLKREEVLMAPQADPEPTDTDDASVMEVKPAEARRIADNRARERRAKARKDILKRLEDATAKAGVGTDVPAGNDIQSRRTRTRIAAGVKNALPTSRPLQEVPRASYHSAEEVDTTGHVGDFEVGTGSRVREDGGFFDPDGVLSLLAQNGAETVPIMVGGIHEPIEVFSLDEIASYENGLRRQASSAEMSPDDALEATRRTRHIASNHLSTAWRDYGLGRAEA